MVVTMRLGPAQLIVRTVCVYNHLVIFERPQKVTTTLMSCHELVSYFTHTAMTAVNRIGYHRRACSANYELKVSSDLKALLCDAPGAAATRQPEILNFLIYSNFVLAPKLKLS